MKVAEATVQVLKAEGTETLFAYPINPIVEAGRRESKKPDTRGQILVVGR